MLWNPFKLSSMKCIDLEPPYPDFHGPFDDNNNLNPAEPSSNCMMTVSLYKSQLCGCALCAALEHSRWHSGSGPNVLNSWTHLWTVPNCPRSHFLFLIALHHCCHCILSLFPALCSQAIMILMKCWASKKNLNEWSQLINIRLKRLNRYDRSDFNHWTPPPWFWRGIDPEWVTWYPTIILALSSHCFQQKFKFPQTRARE